MRTPAHQRLCDHPLTETEVTAKATITTCIFCGAEVTTGNQNKPKRRRNRNGRKRNKTKTGGQHAEPSG